MAEPSDRILRDLQRRWRPDLLRAGLNPGPGPGLRVTRTQNHARVEATLLRWDGAPADWLANPVAPLPPLSNACIFRVEARHPGLPRSLQVAAEPPRSLARVFAPSDVLTHDTDFDARVRLTGDPGFILAAFNKKTREISRECVDAGLVVDGTLKGELRCERPASLVVWLQKMLDLVRRLAMSTDEVPPRLVRICERHPQPAARADALRQLAALGAEARLWPILRRLVVGPAEVQALLHPLVAEWLAAEPARVAELPEEALLAQLDAASVPVRLAIVERLAVVGTAVALPALRDLAGTFFERGGVRSAARSSLEQVLARTHDRVGGLSVVPEAESGLALVDDDL